MLLDDARQTKLRGAGLEQSQTKVREYVGRAVMDARRVNSATSLNKVCWDGALLDAAHTVIELCEELVQLAPDNAGYRDSRGLARALTGDKTGAVLDFAYFVQQRTASGQVGSEAVEARKIAIDLLSADSPFSNADLIELLR